MDGFLGMAIFLIFKEKLLQIYDQRYDLQKIKLNARSQAEQKANWNENFKKLLFSYQLARKKVKG